MTKQVKFRGCEHLDFKDHYTARKEALAGPTGETAFWLREAPYPGAPTMVQFCRLRGRLNFPDACISASKAMCHYYKEVEHTVTVDTDEPQGAA